MAVYGPVRHQQNIIWTNKQEFRINKIIMLLKKTDVAFIDRSKEYLSNAG
jgi:hypothetical protein